MFAPVDEVAPEVFGAAAVCADDLLDPERYLWLDDVDPSDPLIAADWFRDSVPLSADATVGGASFEDVPTGAGLALRCEAASGMAAHLTDAEVLDLVEAAERMRRWADGVRTRAIATYADRHPAGSSAPPPGGSVASPVDRWVPDELGMTLHVGRLEARSLIAEAQRLAHVLPDTLDALQQGRIDERRAGTLSSATAALPDDRARAVEATVLSTVDGATHRQVYDRVRRAVHRVDPDGEFRRHQKARQDRRVTLSPREEGMAALWAYGPAADCEATFTMLTRLARSLGADDPRGLDQRRFDLLQQVVQGRVTVTDLSDLDAILTAAGAPSCDEAAAANGPCPNATGDGDADAGRGDVGRGDAGRSDTGDMGAGDRGAGDRGAGDRGAGDRRAGDRRAGDRRAGDRGAGDRGVGDGNADNDDAEDGAAIDARTGSRDERACAELAGCAGGGRCPDGPHGRDPSARCRHEEPVRHDEWLAGIAAAALARQPRAADTVRKPLIQVVVGLDTLLGSDRPAELVGHGPVPAVTARALAAGGTLQRLVVDPLSGELLDHGRTSYAPPAALADFVRARDQLCRGPGCSRRVQELDHHVRWDRGGDTAEPNLDGYCRTHHVLKELDGWSVLHHADGTVTWVSPAGIRHSTGPYDYRPFVDDVPAGSVEPTPAGLGWAPGCDVSAPVLDALGDEEPPF